MGIPAKAGNGLLIMQCQKFGSTEIIDRKCKLCTIFETRG